MDGAFASAFPHLRNAAGGGVTMMIAPRDNTSGLDALRTAQRKGAVRTAIVLTTIAAAFFIGIIVKYYWLR